MCFFCSTVTFSLLHCIAELILVLIDTLSNQVLNWFFFVFEIIYGNICMFDLFLFLKRIGFLYIFFSHALKSINNRITVLPLKEMRFFFFYSILLALALLPTSLFVTRVIWVLSACSLCFAYKITSPVAFSKTPQLTPLKEFLFGFIIFSVSTGKGS